MNTPQKIQLISSSLQFHFRQRAEAFAERPHAEEWRDLLEAMKGWQYFQNDREKFALELYDTVGIGYWLRIMAQQHDAAVSSLNHPKTKTLARGATPHGEKP